MPTLKILSPQPASFSDYTGPVCMGDDLEHSVRILTDLGESQRHPIVGLVTYPNGEVRVHQWTADGVHRWLSSGPSVPGLEGRDKFDSLYAVKQVATPEEQLLTLQKAIDMVFARYDITEGEQLSVLDMRQALGRIKNALNVSRES